MPLPPGWPSDAEHQRLIGDWCVYQRRGGHRTGTDDFLTAWFAVTHAKQPVTRYLDLGCGIGSVLLMTAHVLRPSASLGIEAQAQSVMMAQRSVRALPAEAPPVQVAQGDIRQLGDIRPLSVPAASFDLVTGSPPYFPLSDGVLPADEQRRACRFEVRGGVEGYCEAAAFALSDEGCFALVFQTRFDARVMAAAEAHALRLVARADVHMREDRVDPFLTVYAFRKTAAPLQRQRFSVRQADGAWTAEYRSARRLLGYQ